MINVDIRIWTPVESACAFQVIPMMIWTPVESVCAFGVSAMVTWTPFEGACALGERLPSIRICKILLKIARGCKSIEFGNCHTQIQLISQSQINSWVVDSSLTGYSTIKPWPLQIDRMRARYWSDQYPTIPTNTNVGLRVNSWCSLWICPSSICTILGASKISHTACMSYLNLRRYIYDSAKPTVICTTCFDTYLFHGNPNLLCSSLVWKDMKFGFETRAENPILFYRLSLG